MKQLVVISSGLVAIALAVYAGVAWYKNNYPPVSSFDECVASGYDTQESNPRVCTAGVKRFHKTLKQ